MDKLLLEAKDIVKSFGAVSVLKGVQFELKAGEVHALMGANGAGKSTLIKILTGAHTKDSGSVYLNGELIDSKTPQEANLRGICAVYQEFSLINELSIAENIFLGRATDGKKFGVIDWKDINKKAKLVLDKLDFNIDPSTKVRSLSVSEKQLVEIAKALSFGSKVLIMDEPTAALSSKGVEKLFDIINLLKSQGIGIVYVSHRMEEIPQIADTVTVFRDGEYVTKLPIKEATREVIIKNMVGRTVEVMPHKDRPLGERILEVRNLTSEGKFSDISLDLHKGEILGLTGLDGAGRTEVVRAIFGADKFDSGTITLESKKLDVIKPSLSIERGIGFVTENRKEEGLILTHSNLENMTIVILDKLKKSFAISKAKEEEIAKAYIADLSIKCDGINQKVGKLSGGNQQKVVLSKWMVTNPKILIVDEPTRGIDIGAKQQIYDLLTALSKQGISIIMISSEIPEVLSLSDRVVIMSSGKITYNEKNNNMDQVEVLKYATMHN